MHVPVGAAFELTLATMYLDSETWQDQISDAWIVKGCDAGGVAALIDFGTKQDGPAMTGVTLKLGPGIARTTHMCVSC